MPDREYKINAIIQELVRRTNDEGRRLRATEQRIDVLENKAIVLEESNLSRLKKVNERFASLEAGIKELGEEIIRFKNSLDKINKQADKFALKRDVKEIERMLDLLSPVRENERILAE